MEGKERTKGVVFGLVVFCLTLFIIATPVIGFYQFKTDALINSEKQLLRVERDHLAAEIAQEFEHAVADADLIQATAGLYAIKSNEEASGALLTTSMTYLLDASDSLAFYWLLDDEFRVIPPTGPDSRYRYKDTAIPEFWRDMETMDKIKIGAYAAENESDWIDILIPIPRQSQQKGYILLAFDLSRMGKAIVESSNHHATLYNMDGHQSVITSIQESRLEYYIEPVEACEVIEDQEVMIDGNWFGVSKLSFCENGNIRGSDEEVLWSREYVSFYPFSLTTIARLTESQATSLLSQYWSGYRFILIIFSFSAVVIAIVIAFLLTQYRKARKNLSEYAQHDSLTGVLNRRAGFQLLQHALKLCRRENLPFSILFIDLDHLKRINDTLGHDHGDLYIQRAVIAVENSIRDVDVFARIGGDELVAGLSDCDQDQAKILVDRIRQEIHLINDSLSHAEKLSISCGVATDRPELDFNLSELVQMADKDMYAEKAVKKRGLSGGDIE